MIPRGELAGIVIWEEKELKTIGRFLKNKNLTKKRVDEKNRLDLELVGLQEFSWEQKTERSVMGREWL